MEKKYIILIEDESLVREAIADALESMGHRVSSFANAKHCERELASKDVDLIITDIFMPEMDGIELIMKIRAKNPSLKIIAISGRGRKFGGFLDAAKKLGASLTLEKPLSIEDIEAGLKTVFEN